MVLGLGQHVLGLLLGEPEHLAGASAEAGVRRVADLLEIGSQLVGAGREIGDLGRLPVGELLRRRELVAERADLLGQILDGPVDCSRVVALAHAGERGPGLT